MHGSLFPPLAASQMTMVFLQGIRFDITAILYLNTVSMILQMLPVELKKNSKFDVFQKVIFVVCNLFGIILSLTDLAFFPFNMKRLDSEILGLLGALPSLMSVYLVSYWYLFLSLFVLIFLLILLYNKTRTWHYSGDKSFAWHSSMYVIILALIALGLRGGFQSRPIKPVLATHFVPTDNVALVTNSPFTFLYSLFNRRLERKNYMSLKEVNHVFPIKKQLPDSSFKFSEQKNIVLIILESFSGACVGHLGAERSFTPYLDSLSKHSLTFTQAYSNGRRSSQGLVALTTGIPALMDDPFMYSPYLNNRIYGLPKLLKDKGYTSSFFNGSNKGMLGWEEYINAVGFDSYYGKEEYPYPDHYDGHWGIYDHHYFDYFIEKTRELKEPFFNTIFTLSSHDPFLVPEEFKEKFNSGMKKGAGYYDALLYSDWSLGRFFNKVQNEEWFDNTIFILVADHTINASDRSPETGFTMLDKFQNRLDIYHIPTLLYSPSIISPEINDKTIQQVDLFNTILSLVAYNGEFYSYGEDVFKQTRGRSFQYVKGVYQLIVGDFILLFKEDKAFGIYNFKEDHQLKNNLIDDKTSFAKALENQMKAIIQQHNNMLIDNNLSL